MYATHEYAGWQYFQGHSSTVWSVTDVRVDALGVGIAATPGARSPPARTQGGGVKECAFFLRSPPGGKSYVGMVVYGCGASKLKCLATDARGRSMCRFTEACQPSVSVAKAKMLDRINSDVCYRPDP